MYFPAREGYIINVSESDSLIERIKAVVDFERKNNTNADVFFKPSRLISIKSNGERHLQNYLALKRGKVQVDSKKSYLLDAGKYGVIDHIGNSNDIDKSYRVLLEYIRDKGFKIQFTALEVLVVSSSLTDKIEEWRTRIQIPLQ